MGIRYSYDDFTTKGHGVIEGPGEHDDSKEALYTFYKNIPKGCEKLRTIDDISEITKRYTFVSKQTANQIIKELEHRYVLRFRNGEYVKRSDAGKYDVYKHKRVTKNSKNRPLSTQKEKLDTTYEHLLKIHNKANGK
jgi:hypothetical protein